jgi:hypothetical protein
VITIATNQYLEFPLLPQALVAPQHIGPPGHRHPALSRAPGCRRRLPRTRSGFDDDTDCNGGADRIGVVPRTGRPGVGREAHPAFIGTLDRGSTLG